jgi:LPS-assembly protein
MGRDLSPPEPCSGRPGAAARPADQGDGHPRRWVRSALVRLALVRLAWVWVALALAGVLAPASHAQTINDRLKPAATSNKTDKMLVEANELVQDERANTVSAEGNVRVYYQGRVLEADKVIYNKTTKRLFAEGHAKLTEKDGTVLHGERFDLTDTFRDGFIDSLRADTKDKTHYSAPRAERIDGETTVFDRATYSACDACADDASKPRLWQVRARRVIHKNEEQMIYYQDAYLEFLGIPVAYVPFFSSPDPTVTRKSGLLAPTSLYKSQLGYGVGLPIFFNLAPNYDLTLTPTVFTQQGFFGAAEFRQRFSNGMYYIRASGLDETNPSSFSNPPYGAGNRSFRGDIQTKGEFQINENWKFGWDIAVLSDKYYLNDYSIPSATLSSNYFSESISTLYLTGQGNRGFFDLRGYYIEGLSSHDIQAQQPVVHPVLDYNHTFDIDPATSRGIGGELQFDFNLTSESAQAASYQSVGAQTLDSAYGLFNVCNTYMPGRATGTSCLLRGIGGEYDRATAELSYQRKYIDPLGEVWTPFAFGRFNGEDLNLNTTASYTYSNAGNTTTFSNASQTAFVHSGLSGTVTPGVGLEYRYPFFANTKIGSITLEPIVQVIARPNDNIGTNSMVNIDSQSLVFDNSNLFDWNKYSGYDQFETGTRANYGGQVSLALKNGGYASFVAGQSAQLAGKNAYATADAANVGLSSGLDTRRSDYVAGATFVPASFISFAANSRFDVYSFEPRRIDLTTSLNFGDLTGGIQFARYTAQPLIGYNVTREGLALNAKYKLSRNYFLQGNVTFDMSRHLYAEPLVNYSDPGLFPIAALGLGGGYTDECTTLMVTYTSVYQDNGTGTLSRNQTVLVSLQLRTLGDAKFSKTTVATPSLDGVK